MGFGDIFSGIINGAVSLFEGSKNRKSVSKENAKSRDFSQYMWNLTNEYNSPLSQMSRLREAQLNPNLVYGNFSSGNASPYHEFYGNSLPSYNYTSALSNVIGSFYDRAFKREALKQDKIRTENAKLTSKNLEADLNIKHQTAENLSLRNKQARVDYNPLGSGSPWYSRHISKAWDGVKRVGRILFSSPKEAIEELPPATRSFLKEQDDYEKKNPRLWVPPEVRYNY